MQKGWERLIQEIEARTGQRSDGDTLEEKMEFYDAKIQARGLSALGPHVELTLAFLMSTGRLCLAQLHDVVSTQPEAAAFFGDPEVASLEMLALCAQTAFDPLAVSAVQEYARLGYDPDAPAANGDRLLHLAAETGRLEMARALLAIGADPNGRDAAGKTPMHRLLVSDLPQLAMREMARTLVQCGASTQAQSKAGLLVEDLLLALGWHQMAMDRARPLPGSGSRRPS